MDLSSQEQGFSESTPLLRGDNTDFSAEQPPIVVARTRLPLILPSAIRWLDSSTSDIEDNEWCPNGLAHSQLVAFKLLLWSQQSLVSKRNAPDASQDHWQRWSTEEGVLEKLAQLEKRTVETWNDFLAELRTNDELRIVICQEFPAESYEGRHIRGT